MDKYENTKIGQAVILAGGMGTRLKPFTDNCPKPMYPIEGKPFLEYLINQIKEFGINNVVLLLGYMAEIIMEYFGDGEKWGVQIQYSVHPVEFETGLRLYCANQEGKLHEEFILLYCDNYCPINYNQLYREYRKNNAMIQVSVYNNIDNYSKSNLKTDSEGRVEIYDKTRGIVDLKGVDIGYAIVNRKIMEYVTDDNSNFEAVVYPIMVEQRKMFGTITRHRYYSVGSWERIYLTETFFKNTKTIFLDRDGTMNVRPNKACYVEKPDDFVWLPNAREAIALLKKNGYRLFVVSNQPGIARGALSIETLRQIDNKIQADLKEYNAQIDSFYYCTHDWDEDCDCRKPKPGLFFQAQKEWSLDLSKCWMLGDDERDMHAGGDAGCKCMYITEQHPLMEAVKMILRLENEK